MIIWIAIGLSAAWLLFGRRTTDAPVGSVTPEQHQIEGAALSRLPYGSHASLARDVTQAGFEKIQQAVTPHAPDGGALPYGDGGQWGGRGPFGR